MAFLVLVTHAGTAAGEYLILPGGIKNLGQESFFGTSSLDIVEVPWGVETIPSRSFAYSSVSKIFLPGTVESIAPDAFEGSDVVLSSPIGSYAQEYAMEYGYPWEDSGAHYRLDFLDETRSIAESDMELPQLEITQSGELSLEGTLTEAQQEGLDAYNAKVRELNLKIESSNSQVQMLYESLRSFADVLPEATILDSGDTLSLSIGGMNLVVDQEFASIAQQDNVEGKNLSLNGETISFQMGGKEYYIASSGSSIFLSASEEEAIASAAAAGDFSWSALQHYYTLIQETLVTAGNAETIIEAVEPLYDTVVGDQEVLVNLAEKELASASEKNKSVWRKTITDEKKKLDFLQKCRKAITPLKKILKGYNIYQLCKEAMEIYYHWREILTIRDHGHPTSEELRFPKTVDISDQLNKDIKSLLILYGTNAVINLCQIYSAVVVIEEAAASAASITLTGFNPVTGAMILKTIVTALGKALMEGVKEAVAGMILDSFEKTRYDSVKYNDGLLHTVITGKVTDEETGKALKGVAVTTLLESCYTDAKGEYRLHVSPLTYTLHFSKKDYITAWSDPVSVARGQEAVLNFAMKPVDKSAQIAGVVYDSVSRKALKGVEVACGEETLVTGSDGNFSFTVEAGTYQMRFYKEQYIAQPFSVTVEEKEVKVEEIALVKGKEIRTREDLEYLQYDTNGDYYLGADIDLSDAPWTPLPWFSGSLDGNFHQITGMKVTGGSGDGAGLFLGLYGGEVMNLTITGAEINVPVDAEYKLVGILGGGANENSKVVGCHVAGDIVVSGGNTEGCVFAGGLAGTGNGSFFQNCTFIGSIKVKDPETAFVGGLIGASDDGTVKDCHIDAQITLDQESACSSPMGVNAYGVFNGNSTGENCHVNGSISVTSIDARTTACGVSGTANSTNNAQIKCMSTSGVAYATGCSGSFGGTNGGTVIAVTQTGAAHAMGMTGVSSGTNTAMVASRAGQTGGSAYAVGCIDCDQVTNAGNVMAATVNGEAVAQGIAGKGPDQCTKCINNGTVTANSVKGSAIAVGLSGCGKDSVNTGNVTSQIQQGSVVAQGVVNSDQSRNEASVSGTYQGTDDVAGSVSVQGLGNCTSSVNTGFLSAKVIKSTTSATVTGISGGSQCENLGRVEARNQSGQANARGVMANNCINRGAVFAHSSSTEVNESSNATAYGIGGSYSDSHNYGDITAISKSSRAYAYGYGSGSGCTSTGLVSATSQYFWQRPKPGGGSEGGLGSAYAVNSNMTQATVGGYTISAAGDERVNMYYFLAGCSKHKGEERRFVSFEPGTVSIDGCYVPAGYAYAVSSGN